MMNEESETPSAERLLEIITRFIIRKHGELGEPLTLETRLIDEKLVDSFGLVALGTEISRALKIPLLTGNLLPEDFETPETLLARIREISS